MRTKILIKTTSTVCSKHFINDCYEIKKTSDKKSKLKFSAVPTVFVTSKGQSVVAEITDYQDPPSNQRFVDASPAKKPKLNDILELTDVDIKEMEIDECKSTLKRLIISLKQTSRSKKFYYNKYYASKLIPKSSTPHQEVKMSYFREKIRMIRC